MPTRIIMREKINSNRGGYKIACKNARKIERKMPIKGHFEPNKAYLE